MPFSPAWHLKRVGGKEVLIAFYGNWPSASGKAEFTDGIVL
jgi:hypothetical protein